MKPLVVVENGKRWPLELEGVQVVSARDYLVDPAHAGVRGVTVFNLSRSYAYQTFGYYVSLLAEARGHRPLPSVATLRGLREGAVVRTVSEDLSERMQRALKPLKGDDFELSVYFGRNLARRYDALARGLFNELPMPLMRARFHRQDGEWSLVRVRPVATAEIPDTHREFVLEQARDFFQRGRVRTPERRPHRWDLAVLWSEDDPDAPSDARALKAFERAFHAADIEMHVLGPDELGRVAEHDALFIRETTRVDHHTYRFARRAQAAGLVVVDDPESIVRCTNKVFQHEAFQRHGIPTPPTVIVDARGRDAVEAVGLPCVLKEPDGAFSRGVRKVGTAEERDAALDAMLAGSDLVVAQAFTPSDFDWRVGILGGEALWAARYHMVPGHWQIARADAGGSRYGKVEAVALEDVPEEVVALALRAAALMGDGLYGVDLKEVDGRLLVMEVNDNPNIEAGYEDAVVGAALYERVAGWFRARLEARGQR